MAAGGSLGKWALLAAAAGVVGIGGALQLRQAAPGGVSAPSGTSVAASVVSSTPASAKPPAAVIAHTIELDGRAASAPDTTRAFEPEREVPPRAPHASGRRHRPRSAPTAASRASGAGRAVEPAPAALAVEPEAARARSEAPERLLPAASQPSASTRVEKPSLADTALKAELKALDAVRSALRGGDTAGAGRALDDYFQRFPVGYLAPEARALARRIQAAQARAR